jgi:hypothetical protein
LKLPVHILLLSTVLASPLVAASEGPGLRDEAWSERKYGITVNPPAQSRLSAPVADPFGYLLVVHDEAGRYVLSITVKRTTHPRSLERLVAGAFREQIKDASSQALDREGRLLKHPEDVLNKDLWRVKIAGRDAGLLYRVRTKQVRLDKFHKERGLKLFDFEKRKYLFAQAIVPVDKLVFLVDEGSTQKTRPDGSKYEVVNTKKRRIEASLTFAAIEMECEMSEAKWARPLFESVLGSLQIPSQKPIQMRRAKEIQAGHQWRSRVKVSTLHKAIVPEQMLRVQERDPDGTFLDVGFVVIRQKFIPAAQQALHKSGIRISFMSRIKTSGPKGAFFTDTAQEFFLSDEADYEQWRTITTKRRMTVGRVVAAKVQNFKAIETLREDAVRIGSTITVNSDRRARRFRDAQRAGLLHNDVPAEIPKYGYLSQVEMLMLPQLLRVDRPGTFGFYVFNGEAGKVFHTTHKVVPSLSGFVIHSQSSPNALPIIAEYDAERRLIRQEVAGKRRFLPTNKHVLQQLWNHALDGK